MTEEERADLWNTEEDGGTGEPEGWGQDLKYDSGKPRLALVPPEMIEAVGRVMTDAIEGPKHYREGSWADVAPARYRDALVRHLCAYLKDPKGIDEDSKMPALWHVLANAAFLTALDMRGKA